MVFAQAENTLIKCESELKKLLEKSAREGDYDAVDKLTLLARQVGHMAETVKRKTDTDRTAIKPTPARHIRKQGRLSEYPRFIKRNEQLVKIAWSKKEKKEYE